MGGGRGMTEVWGGGASGTLQKRAVRGADRPLQGGKGGGA